MLQRTPKLQLERRKDFTTHFSSPFSRLFLPIGMHLISFLCGWEGRVQSVVASTSGSITFQLSDWSRSLAPSHKKAALPSLPHRSCVLAQRPRHFVCPWTGVSSMTEPCFAAEPLGWLPFTTILAHKSSKRKKKKKKVMTVLNWSRSLQM